ncbi:helix-turn-helix domain-containing protein [Duganella sp. FT50W]|uniref:Helix-turn-helix domain-containing protein n=1 Tax=Duganella lactea TaxID=2692173 RepID=A0A6L8MCM6_9BURK|nr:helix-turn-helix domain-containing protein [Duganella lactea]MYM80457.1 helix-turn-helix domain-containing protein [Duganella lactea]
MVNTIISWLFLAAIAQAVFLSISLIHPRQPEMRTANRLLSALLLIFSAIIGHAWLGLNHLYQAYPHSALAIVTLGLAVGPLLYLYLHAILSDAPLGRRALLHFLPFAVTTLAMLPFYLRTANEKLAWMRGFDGWPWYLALFAVVKMAILFCYLRAGHRLVQRVPAESALVADLRRLMRVWLFSAGLSVLAVAMAAADADLPLSVEAVDGGALMLFVFATAYTAMRLPLGYRPQALPPAPPPKPRYADKPLAATERDAFLARLTSCMEQDQPFRNGELKLEELATQVALTPHELSQIINQHCGVNFADFLNRYRVDALKTALHDPRQASTSILDLSLMAGFNSKSAMNRAFKKHTGMTPGEFREQAQAPA